MKTDANFRLSKTTKRRLGTFIGDKAGRSLYKKAMMVAEVNFADKGFAIQGGKNDKDDKE